MKISFNPEFPKGEDWDTIKKNVSNELGHFEDRYTEFPNELIVKVEIDKPQLSISGAAMNVDGTPIVTIEYSLLYPHLGQYQYVGGSLPAEL